MKKTSLQIFIILALAVGAVFAQTTEFTYQGSLRDGTTPANANYDFEFALFDASAGGTQIGSTLTRASVAVTDGNFAVKLDFGSNFPGANRFLEIRVRQTGGGAFTPLAPRQQINSAPYSVKSVNADNATTATTATNATNAVNATNAANFTGSLSGDVTGTQGATTVARLQSRNVAVTAPLDGQVLKYSGAASQWQPDTDIVGSGGGGTITGVTPGTGLTGGGATGNVTLNIANGGVGTAQLADNSVTDAKINSVSGSKVTGAVANATQLGGVAASQYVLTGDARLSDARAPTAGSSNYVQNTTVQQADAHFNISGSGTAGGTLSGNWVNSITTYGIGGRRVLSVTGVENVFAGVDVGNLNTGSSNSFFGRNAGLFNATGNNNSFFGFNAGFRNEGGSNNTIIGGGANVATNNLTNATAIGAGSVVSTSNTIALGRSAGQDAVQIPGALSVTGALTANGSGLNNLNAGNITTGTLPDARLAGTYAGPLSLTNAGNTLTGSGAGLTLLNATNINTGTLNALRLPVPLTLIGSSSGPIIRGQNDSAVSFSSGVFGVSTGTTGQTYGGRFESASPVGTGVAGWATAGSSSNQGGDFRSASTDGTGVFGWATAGTGTTYAVQGRNDSTSGRGVYGLAFAGTGTNYGVYGESFSSQGYAGYFRGFGPDTLYVQNTGTGRGIRAIAFSDTAIWATTTSGFAGLDARNASPSGLGVFGLASATTGTNYGVLGQTSSGSGYGVYSNGNMGASGTKPFRIDHPDDPANKYLLHYAAESPEVINFYSGKATLDAAGEAVVELPAYFAKINKDPRYTLTALGAPMPMLHVAAEIDEAALSAGAKAGPGVAAPKCSFRIAGGQPGMKVSWEVKAVRNDKWMQQRQAPVEVEKEGVEKGTYQHPELYGQPKEKGMNYDATRERGEAERRASPEPLRRP